MKKIIIGFIVGALMFSIMPVMAQEGLIVVPNPFPVVIDGVVTEVEGYNINGYTFLKLADFGKVGLTVKFNETQGQIEIETKEKAVITPEPMPDKGDDDMVERYMENGYEVIKKDGVEYYLMGSTMDIIRPKGYRFFYDSETQKYSLTYNDDYPAMAISRAVVVLEDIPYIIFGDRSYIPKNYYINVVLPELEVIREVPEPEMPEEPQEAEQGA